MAIGVGAAFGLASAASAMQGTNSLLGSYAMSQWNRQANEGLAVHSSNLSKAYDTWQTNYLYPLQLKAQLENYADEQILASMRQRDAVANQRAALENSGYNPLLAVGDVAGGSIQPLAIPDKSSNFSGSNSAQSYHANNLFDEYFKVKSAFQNLEANSATVKEKKADADLARSDADLQILRNSAEISALEGDNRGSPIGDDVSVLTHEGWKQLRNNINEKLRKEGYTESEARVRTLDILHETEKVVDSAAGAATSAASLKRAFRKSFKHSK